MHNGCISEGRADLEGEAWERRQKLTTWGMVPFAGLVTAGMVEWSRRSAADEVIVDEKILQQAIQIAAEARDSGIKGLRDSESGKRISDFGFRNSDSGKNLSDLGVSAVKPAAAASNVKVNVNVNEKMGSGWRPSFAASPLRGTATEGFWMETSAGGNQ